MITENVYKPKVSQAAFTRIEWYKEKWLFCVKINGEIDLKSNNLVKIDFKKNEIEYKFYHYVAYCVETNDFVGFTIDDELFLDESILIELKKNGNSYNEIIGFWSKDHPYELSISNCAAILRQMQLDRHSPLYKLLFELQELRNAEFERLPQICTKEFLHKTLNISMEELEFIDVFNIDKMNELLGGINETYVNYDSRVVHFNDSFILTHIHSEGSYFVFLCAFLSKMEIYNIDKFLDYHVAKHFDYKIFCIKLEDFITEFSENYQVRESVKNKVTQWISNKRIETQKPKRTTLDILRDKLSELGFFQLEKVKSLTDASKVKLVELLHHNNLPYKIAMIDFLGFIVHLDKNYFNKIGLRNIELAKVFNSSKDGRDIKGNINSLRKRESDKNERYTSFRHLENVEIHYNSLS